MDAITCVRTGKTHAAQSGQDYTLCIVKELDHKLRAVDNQGNGIWDEVIVGARAERVLPLVTCRVCKRILASQLPFHAKERCKR